VIEQKTLSLEQAQAVIDAVINRAKEIGHRGVAVCVVDKASEIISCARMDNMHPRYGKAAHRKAYTAAVFERDTNGVIKFWDQQAQHGHRGASDWNDPMLTTLPGGLCVLHGQDVVGGIAVAGGNGQFDDWQFAEVGFEALGPGYRHRVDWN
jgi:uncharacterized protein GlcG (DUF336 family)